MNILDFAGHMCFFGPYSFSFLNPEKMYKPLLDRGGAGGVRQTNQLCFISGGVHHPCPQCRLFSEQYGDFVSKLSGQPSVCLNI